MLKLGKLTDYAVVILGVLAQERDLCSASDVALQTHLPEPTVGKILKMLTKAKLLQASRGAQGGYSLIKPLSEISVADLVEVMEGGFSLTSCVDDHKTCCTRHNICPMRSGWDELNGEILDVFRSFSIRRLLKSTQSKDIRQVV